MKQQVKLGGPGVAFTLRGFVVDSTRRFIISLEHEVLMVSFCDRSMSVVRCASSVVLRPSCGVRRQQLL